MVLKEHLARYVSGHLSQGQLPHLAELALEEGYDSPSLRVLAGLKPGDWEIDSYWQRTLKEVDLSFPSENEACTIIQREYAEKIIQGDIYPLNGLSFLVTDILKFPYNERQIGSNFMPLYLLFFNYYYYDYLLVDPSDFNKLNEAIVAASQEFLACDPANENYVDQPTYEQINNAARAFFANASLSVPVNSRSLQSRVRMHLSRFLFWVKNLLK